MTVDAHSISKVNDPHRERLNYWEISCYLSCPVIGTCLSVNEQKKILKRARINPDDHCDYEIHEKLVESCKAESPLSRRIHRYLDGKYRNLVAEIGLCTREEFFARWKEGLKDGDVEGLLWVGATNPRLSERATNQLFTDMHMLMHLQGNEMRRERQRASRLKTKNQQLTVKLREAQKRARQSAQALSHADKELVELERKLQTAQQENQALKREEERENLQKENHDLRVRLEKLEYDLQTRNTALDQAKLENERISAELAAQMDTNRQVQKEINSLLRTIASEEAECEICPNRDLCEQRVLLVGGLIQLQAVYRTLVEDVGGEFKYHNGRTKGGERNLENLVGWADVVLCPVDVNSHSAALGVKRMCKKMEKPYFMLRSSSVSSIARALDDVAETTG